MYGPSPFVLHRFLQGLAEDLQAIIDLLAGDIQRRNPTKGIVVGSTGEQEHPFFFSLVNDLFDERFRLGLRAVNYEFRTDHEPLAAHIANLRILFLSLSQACH